MKDVILLLIKTAMLLVLLFVGLALIAKSDGNPWKAQVVVDLEKTDNHLNVGVGWHRIYDGSESNIEPVRPVDSQESGETVLMNTLQKVSRHLVAKSPKNNRRR